jgi:peptidoglycan/xylan/chitin deacetylase (PgdA/CDA1 family)/ribosomal protein S18 acetylase RimI-like enzyme
LNDHLITNLLKIAVSYVLYYTGLLHVLSKLFVRRGLWIFNYHGFSTFANDYWNFGSLYTSGYGGNFEKQVRYFEKDFRKLTDFNLAEALGGRPAYFLTFDDGYKDNFDIALPVIVKLAIPSIFFIVTGAIGTDGLLWYDSVRLRYEQKRPRGRWAASRLKRACKKKLARLKLTPGTEGQWMRQGSPETSSRLMMNWDEVRGADSAGVLIGAHTDTHPIMSLLSSESQREEIRTSIETIKQRTDRSPEFFSYPEGRADSFNEETVRILKERGVRFAVTTEDGVNELEDLPYCLRRIGMNPSDPVPVVALKIALIGLRKELHLRGLKEWNAQTGVKIRQYGPWNAVKRAFKAALRMIGIHIETYWVLTRDLGSHIEAPAPVPGLVVKRLRYEDFKASPFFREFSPEKRELLERRFSSPDHQAFGAERNGELVYMTWIATDSLRIEAIHFEQQLGQDEGVLLDSMTLPKVRGLGIHSYMNSYRLARLQEKGVKKVYVAVLAENRPALKTQVKSGFRHGERILWLSLGRSERYFRKEVHFSPRREMVVG